MKLDARHILKNHVATERTTVLREANNEYVFEVDKHANKYHIRQAVEEAFKVHVESVNTMLVPGKKRRIRREEGKTPTWKKAIVRLKKGESIAAFENI